MSSSKQQVLETISSISKIIMLTFKPIGTKIAIRNHTIVLCDSDLDENGIWKSYMGVNLTLQGIERYWNGDSRDDLYVLNHVLTNFIELYVMSHTGDQDMYNRLVKMCQYICCGLKRLQETYIEGNVVAVLQYYINVLQAVINNTYNKNMLYSTNHLDPHNKKRSNNDEEKDNMEYSSIFDKNKIKNFWSNDELKSIITQFDKCFKSNIDDDPNDDAVFNENHETDHTKYIESGLPIPKNPLNALVSGYLVGIQKIITTMDNRFINMLDKSVKGKK